MGNTFLYSISIEIAIIRVTPPLSVLFATSSIAMVQIEILKKRLSMSLILNWHTVEEVQGSGGYILEI